MIEDEAIVAMDIAMQLRKMGCIPVGIAASGEQAIEMSVRLQPDLALMDIHLASAMDGITAAQTMRTQCNVPVIFLSAFVAEEKSRARASQSAPLGYLNKPFSEYELQTVIDAALKYLRP